MLVLSRKVDEAIVINENIKVRVIKIKGKQVQLGIETPTKDMKIHREEVQVKINNKGKAV